MTYMQMVPVYLSSQQKEKMVMTASGKTMNLMPKPQQSRSIAAHIEHEMKKQEVRRKHQQSVVIGTSRGQQDELQPAITIELDKIVVP